MPKQEIPLLNLSPCVSVREYRGSARRARGLNSTMKKVLYPKNNDSLFNLCAKITVPSATPYIAARKVQRTDTSKNIRSYFKFIPRQIEAYVEADGSPRYAVNSGLLTKIKGFQMPDRGSIWPEHTCLK